MNSRHGKKLGKMVLALLAFAILGLSGCSNRKDDNSPELITLDVYTQLANWNGYQIGWYSALLEDKFGVRINIIGDTEGVYETRVESGNMGDLIAWGSNGDQYQNAVNLGLLFDWEEDDLCQTYAPNIWNNAQNALESNREISGDGQVYGVGHALARDTSNHQSFFYTWDLRWDLYKKLGYPEVTDLDSYVEMLKDMKEINPVDLQGNETYAVSLWPDWDGSMVMYVKAMATAFYGYDEHCLGLFDPETGVYHDTLEIGGPYLESLKFFNDLYQNDLLDPDSAIQTYQQVAEKVKNGGTLFSIFNYSGSLGFNTDENIANGMMMMPMMPSNARVATYGMSVLGGNRVWSIGSESRYPELCMEILNFLYSPTGAMTIWYGLPGLHWYYDEEGYTHFTELGNACRNDPKYDMAGITWLSPDTGKEYLLGGSFTDGCLQVNNTTWALDAKNPDSKGESFNYEFWKSYQQEPRNEAEADWREYTGFVNTQDYMEDSNYMVVPGTSYAESPRTDEQDLVWTQVTTAIKNFSWRAIYADSDAEFDRIVNTMINMCNQYGYADMVEWSQTEADRKYAMQLALQANENK